MAAWVKSMISPFLVILLLINYNYAEETRNEPSITLKDNDDVLLANSTYPWEEDVELEGESHIRQSRDLRHLKSLKLRLEWFDKSTDALVGGEYSRDLRDDGTVIEELGLSIVDNVNNGGYDVQPGWVGILQGYFKHRINLGAFDYQVAFDYREWWEDMRVIEFLLYPTPSWRKQKRTIYINLTPDVSGEIVRAIYRYTGHKDPSTVMRVHLLGTSFDCSLRKSEDIEFFPTQKQLVRGQAFEVTHGTHATKTRHDKFEVGRPLPIKLTFTVRVKT